MKKFFYFAMMAVVTLGFTACGSDDDENGPLVGTQWVYEEVYSETEDGITYESIVSITTKFTTATSGKLVLHGDYTVNGQSMGESYNEEQAFTYTYDGTANSGRGTMSAVDEESGEVMTLPFTVDGNELTIIDIDEDTGEQMPIVFTRK